MPFQGQGSSNHSHRELVVNSEIVGFLSKVQAVPRPVLADAQAYLADAVATADTSGPLTGRVIAIDGSYLEQPIDVGYPSRRIGSVKVAAIELDTRELAALAENRFPDPFAVNAATSRASVVGLVLPGAYVATDDANTARESFRANLFSYLSSPATRIDFGDGRMGRATLADTLVALMRHRPGVLTRGGDGRVVIRMARCPDGDCDWSHGEKGDLGRIAVDAVTGTGHCPNCGTPIFSTDSLRLFEPFSEHGENGETFGRVMLAVEHLQGIHILRERYLHAPQTLPDLALMLDGPLAVSGPSHWLCRAIMAEHHEIRLGLRKAGLGFPLVIGLQKTGRLVEHLENISQSRSDALLAPGTIMPVSDAYRTRFVEPGRATGRKNFGDETYYGQDFFAVLPSGRRYVFCLAYPFAGKPENFHEYKHLPVHYGANDGALGRAVALLEAFETDIFPNALVPTVLAHQRASLSQKTGGKALRLTAEGET